MQSGKRYFSPQVSNKRKSQQPYFVDRRLTPRVKEYLNSYECDSLADPDEVVDYLQMTFQEYARKKRNSLRQSVEKVLNSFLLPDKKMKKSKQGDSLKNRKSGTDFINEQYDSQSTDDDEDLIETKDTNMINNSMHLIYKKTSSDGSKFQGKEDLKVECDGILTSNCQNRCTTDRVGTEDLATLGNEEVENSKRILDQAKILEMSTPVPSPSGGKNAKSDTQQPKPKRKRKDDAEKKQDISSKKGIQPSESRIRLSDIGGYESALEEVMKLLFHLKHPEVFQQLGVKPPRGFLLHGPPGCGKTLLANAIAGELQLPYYKLAATEIVSGVSGESEEKLRDLFATAQVTSPSIVFLDEIDAVAPNRENASKDMERRIVSQLLVCMDDLDRADCDVLLIGATNRPDSLDPALRRAGRFDREICLGIPDKCARERILQVVCNDLRLSNSFDYENIAALTPGFVGADLVSLTREAAMFAVKRIFENLEHPERGSPVEENIQDEEEKQMVELKEDSSMAQSCIKASSSSSSSLSWLKDRPSLTPKQLEEFFIEAEDFKQALSTVQPSAKREGFATVPDVSWEDIGALEDIRDELSLAILAPVRHSEEFLSLGIANPPGILLAGPPGCGKTLLAKAIANEAGINFISVKGPELLNMYVGESERAVRQVFQRARNSAPCVIFFDEIDALCPKRSDIAESSASSRVVNQLLTEMDGLVVRKQVFLMGATNRPDIIDPAILRPGRLDKILFVGLPSSEDRVKILQTITKFGTKPKFAADVVLTEIARDLRCERFSGADLAALVREASVQTLKEFMKCSIASEDSYKTLELRMEHFEKAFHKLRPSVSLEDQKWYDKLKSKYGCQ